ncbi:hypothetical protein PNOK_0516900 [Pyrrhoderma noxium]|uniref:Uncharacterized protein n=1 Tax=Pyrrhoderma noxium TaxID=2282107 RepID=A0A286ULA5_9AGAM|nr:hypothetical protein PNOK_0516900 [Pyrrhoderma noxium]
MLPATASGLVEGVCTFPRSLGFSIANMDAFLDKISAEESLAYLLIAIMVLFFILIVQLQLTITRLKESLHEDADRIHRLQNTLSSNLELLDATNHELEHARKQIVLLEHNRHIKEDILSAIQSTRTLSLSNGWHPDSSREGPELLNPDQMPISSLQGIDEARMFPPVDSLRPQMANLSPLPSIFNINFDAPSHNDTLLTRNIGNFKRSVRAISTKEEKNCVTHIPTTPVCVFKGRVKSSITDSTRKALSRNFNS